MTTQRRQPSAKVQGTQGPMDAQSYLKQLDDLLKRNTGQGTFVGQDTSSNTPMYLPGKVVNPTGLGETPSTMAYGNGMTQPAPTERNAPEVYQEPQQNQQPQQDSQDGQQQSISAQDFLQRFEQSYNAPENRPQTGVPQKQGIASTQDGGTLMEDGTIEYPDGTYRIGDSRAIGIASMRDGSTLYSDQSVRRKQPQGIASLRGQRERILYDDNTARYGAYQYGEAQPSNIPTEGGLEGLAKGIFGMMPRVTQVYGNYNPSLEPGRGYNDGTDLATKDLQNYAGYKVPVDAEVVSVYRNAAPGSGYEGNRENSGWGNSVVIRFNSGEMARFSHLDTVAEDIQPGQKLAANQIIGTPGSTGNVTGEHLDLTYYNSQGQIDDPKNFTGFINPQGLRTPLPGQPAPGTVAPTGREQLASLAPQINSSVNQSQAPQQQSQPVSLSYPGQTMNEGLVQPAINAVKEAPKNVFSNAAKTVNAVNPTGKFDLGATEGLITPEAASTRMETAKQFAFPQENRAFLGKARQSIGNLAEQVGNMAGIPETGVSEIIAGGKTRQTNQTFANELDQSAAQNEQSGQSLGIKQNVTNVLNQAGQGIKSLGQSGVDTLQNVFKPKQDVAKRAVGDVSGTADQPGQAGQFSSLMDTAQSMANIPKNNVKDPFFKYGGSEMYKSFLRPDAENVNGGALSLDTFTPDFYKDLSNVSSVFGGSKDLAPATEKYVANEQQKYPKMSRMGYEDGYDRGDIDNYNSQIDKYNNSLSAYFNDIRSSVNGAQSIFTPPPTGSSKNVFASSAPQMSVRPGSSAPLMSVAPRMSVAPKPAPQMSFAAPQASVSAPSYTQALAPQQSNRPGSSAPQMSVAPQPSQNMSVAPRMSVAPKQAPQMSVAPRMSVAPKPAQNMSVAPKPQSKPTSNVFSKVTSAIKNIFRR